MLLDTNAISAWGSRMQVFLRYCAATGPGIFRLLPAIALGEYRFGVVSSTRRAALEQWLTEVEVACVVLAPDAGTARHYAAIRDTLRRANTPIRRVGW